MAIGQKSKYRSQKIQFGGETFDSRKEYRRYRELKLLEEAGEISALRRQVPFELVPAQRGPDTTGPRGGVRKGKLLERPVAYIADFVYRDPGGNLVVEDVKGVRTKEYIIKRKLMLYVYGIRVKET